MLLDNKIHDAKRAWNSRNVVIFLIPVCLCEKVTVLKTFAFYSPENLGVVYREFVDIQRARTMDEGAEYFSPSLPKYLASKLPHLHSVSYSGLLVFQKCTATICRKAVAARAATRTTRMLWRRTHGRRGRTSINQPRRTWPRSWERRRTSIAVSKIWGTKRWVTRIRRIRKREAMLHLSLLPIRSFYLLTRPSSYDVLRNYFWHNKTYRMRDIL